MNAQVVSHHGLVESRRPPRVRKQIRKRRRLQHVDLSWWWGTDSASAGGRAGRGPDLLTNLPDEMIIHILTCLLSLSSASCADILCVMLTCKRLKQLVMDPSVLQKASMNAIAVNGNYWSESANKFLHRCRMAGNNEATYMLGMINFYCLGNHVFGELLLKLAMSKRHAAAFFSSAVIRFNGSGRSSAERNLEAGVRFSFYAASLGDSNGMRELSHCLNVGHGTAIRPNLAKDYIINANICDFEAFTKSNPAAARAWHKKHYHVGRYHLCPNCDLTSELAYYFPVKLKPHPANKFMLEWFKSKGIQPGDEIENGRMVCCSSYCGRGEKRVGEFRRCCFCQSAWYCSKACLISHWKAGHRRVCFNLRKLWMRSHGGQDPLTIGDYINYF